MKSENYKLMEAFEQAWKDFGNVAANPPAWQDFVVNATSDDLLVYLIELDIEQRIRRRMPAIISQRYWEHPIIASRLSDEQIVAFIRGEVRRIAKARVAGELPERFALGAWDHKVAASVYAAAFPTLEASPGWHSIPWTDLQATEPQEKENIAQNNVKKTHRPIRSDQTSSSSEMIGPYRLLERLGEGGMGEVWLAEQIEPLRRRVALKRIKRGLDDKQVIARFEAERQVLALMNHSNIAKVLDAGTTSDGRPFFVMELVEGVPLTKYCDNERLSISERLKLFIAVCDAVQHAHQKGIIHRDLKPTNVLVCTENGTPTPKVIDFGLAKALQSTTYLTDQTFFTEFGQIVGTLQYMSPEQADLEQKDIDTRTDIYSLGVILYELLTGSTPLDEATLRRQALLEVLENIRELEPPRPSSRLSGSSNDAVNGISSQRQIEPARLKRILQGELDWIVMRALEKDRVRRYETANGFAEDLLRYLRGEVVVAKPPSITYRVGKFARRHRGLVTSLAIIAALLIAGIVGTSWFAWSEQIARKDAESARDQAKKEKENAVIARDTAKMSEQKAKMSEQKAQTRLVRQYTATGQAALDAGDWIGAMPWYAAACQLESDPIAIESHRIRLQLLSTLCPKVDSVLPHESNIADIAFSPDGQKVAVGCIDGTASIWQVQPDVQRRLVLTHDDPVVRVLFNPAGTLLATLANQHTGRNGSGSLRLFDANTGQLYFGPLRHQPKLGKDDAEEDTEANPGVVIRGVGLIVDAVWSGDGNQIITASDDGSVVFWDARTGNQVGLVIKLDQSPTAVDISPDGKTLLVTLQGKTIYFFDAQTHVEKTQFTAQGWPGRAKFSSSGKLVFASQSGEAWDLSNAQPLDFPEGVELVDVSRDGQRAAAYNSLAGSAQIWDFSRGRWDSNQVSQKMGEFVYHPFFSDSHLPVRFLPDGFRFMTVGESTTIWTPAFSGHKIPQTLCPPIPHTSRTASISADATMLATASNSSVVLWSLCRSAPVPIHSKGKKSWISPRGNFCVEARDRSTTAGPGTGGGEIQIIDTSTGEMLPTIATRFPVQSHAIDASDRFMAIGSGSNGAGEAMVWQLANTELPPKTIPHPAPVIQIAISLNGKTVATVTEGNQFAP